MPPVFCSRCNTNWHEAYTQHDEEGDESYDACPMCKTDSSLQEGREGDTYLFCHITGKVTNAITRHLVKTEAKQTKEYRHVNYRAIEQAEANKAAIVRERKEEAALSAYQKALPKGEVEARKQYFKVYNETL